MKNINTIIGLFFTSALMICCSTNKHSEPDNIIHLSAGLSANVEPSSRAAIEEGSTFKASVAGWESKSTTADYTKPKSWISESLITANQTTSEITLSPIRSYNQDSEVKTYIKAWYPSGVLSEDGIVTFTDLQDGKTDVMLSDQAVGSIIDSDDKNLPFSHQLTQLKFKIKGDDTFSSATLTSIAIKDAALPTSIDLNTDNIIYGDPISLAIPNISSPQPITLTETAIGEPIMIKPFASNTFKIDVVTSETTYNDVKVTINNDLSFAQGKSYTITLTFKGTNIKVSAGVTPWITNGTGSGTVFD